MMQRTTFITKNCIRPGHHLCSWCILIQTKEMGSLASVYSWLTGEPKQVYPAESDDMTKIELRVHENIPPPFEVKLSSGPTKAQPLVTTYPMTSRNRGVAFIVNIISFANEEYTERRGAKIDGQNLISLFQQLGFTVFYYETLTMAQYKALMAQLKTSNHLSCDCFVFYILSHGFREEKTNRDLIAFHDCSHLAVQDILAEFSTKNCTKLIGKPKLFFFSVCRGNKADFGMKLTEHDGARLKASDPVSVNIPTFVDMMLCYATVPGFAAIRDITKGSWFVESMCKIWAKHAHEMDVETMMKLVGKDTATNRTCESELQTICTEQWGFFHQLFLNPGYYEFAQDERS